MTSYVISLDFADRGASARTERNWALRIVGIVVLPAVGHITASSLAKPPATAFTIVQVTSSAAR